MSLNEVQLMGNLTRDPEFKVFESGSCVARFGLAINEKYKDADGNEQEDVCFVDVETWNRQAEIVSEFCHKGKRVVVVGGLKLDTWEKDGEKRSKLKVRGRRVIFAESRAEEEKRAENKASGGGYNSEGRGGGAAQEPPANTQASVDDDDDIPF